MPVENENKYVLDVPSVEGFANKLRHLKAAEAFAYRQGYLNENTRIREVKAHNGDESFLFTFKIMVNGKLVEVEDEISKADFNLLWVTVDRVMVKTRIKVPVGERIWEVDFMHTSDGRETYLVMAEVEMGEDETDPGALPGFISEHLLYAVPKGDMRFVNSRLTQPNVVRKLVQGIKDGTL
jgi:CYTH domain-containing protein